MIVRCKFDRGQRLYEEYGPNHWDTLFRFGYFYESKLGGLSVGREFLVMGVFVGFDGLSYLVDNDGYADMYSAILFDVVDNKIPSCWFSDAKVIHNDDTLYHEFTLGYQEFVFDENHWPLLVERDRTAYAIYHKRLKETREALGLFDEPDDPFPPSTWLP